MVNNTNEMCLLKITDGLRATAHSRFARNAETRRSSSLIGNAFPRCIYKVSCPTFMSVTFPFGPHHSLMRVLIPGKYPGMVEYHHVRCAASCEKTMYTDSAYSRSSSTRVHAMLTPRVNGRYQDAPLLLKVSLSTPFFTYCVTNLVIEHSAVRWNTNISGPSSSAHVRVALKVV